jgi:uncharacterized Zn finger protein
MSHYYDFGNPNSIAKKKKRAQKVSEQLRIEGIIPAPIIFEGEKIATHPWAKKISQLLLDKVDEPERVAKGRSYLKNNFIVHFEQTQGHCKATIVGENVYQVNLTWPSLKKNVLKKLLSATADDLCLLIELLQKTPDIAAFNALERLALMPDFIPALEDLKTSCTCLNWWGECKHVFALIQALIYLIDRDFSFLFKLLGQDLNELSDTAKEVFLKKHLKFPSRGGVDAEGGRGG